jgi:DNA-binding NarL/FixJ family response regulator
MIKILIADDHMVVRKGLRQIIQEQPDMYVGGEACNGQEVLTMVYREEWDVIILDISLPLRNGLEVLQAVRHYRPKLPVLVLSVYSEEQYGLRMLRSGAAGYMNKECALDQLIAAIHKVVSGGRYVSPILAERLAFSASGDFTRAQHEYLSNREYDVLVLLGNGKAPKEIAHMLSLSIKTVSTYRARILEKLGLQNTAELIRYVLEHQLLEAPVRRSERDERHEQQRA